MTFLKEGFKKRPMVASCGSPKGAGDAYLLDSGEVATKRSLAQLSAELLRVLALLAEQVSPRTSHIGANTWALPALLPSRFPAAVHGLQRHFVNNAAPHGSTTRLHLSALAASYIPPRMNPTPQVVNPKP
jgi:hypothetical protein